MKSRPWGSALLVVLALVAAGSSGCAKPSANVRPGAVDDAILTTRVKTALINDPAVFDPRIDVDTVKGVVTLSGRVTTKEQEARAVELARKIAGVTDVKSALQIGP